VNSRAVARIGSGAAVAAGAAWALLAQDRLSVLRVRTASGGWITVPELKQRWTSGTPLMMIDVREPEEFVGPLGHLPGARNIPMADLPAHLGELKNAAHHDNRARLQNG